MKFRFPRLRLLLPAALLLPLLHAAPSRASTDQVWYGQSISLPASETLRLRFSNTDYVEGGKHFANEEAASFRWNFSPSWDAGAGVTFSQTLIDDGVVPDDEGSSSSGRRHWDVSDRPSEHFAVDWRSDFGRWTLADTSRFDLKFRKGERDWTVYRQIATVTAPALPHLPWMPRPYLSQQIYVSGRQCFTGLDRFSQFRWTLGLRMAPSDMLRLSVYCQYRDIERPNGQWDSFRIVGLTANLVF